MKAKAIWNIYLCHDSDTRGFPRTVVNIYSHLSLDKITLLCWRGHLWLAKTSFGKIFSVGTIYVLSQWPITLAHFGRSSVINITTEKLIFKLFFITSILCFCSYIHTYMYIYIYNFIRKFIDSSDMSQSWTSVYSWMQKRANSVFLRVCYVCYDAGFMCLRGNTR